MNIELTFENQTSEELSEYEKKYHLLIDTILKHLNLDGNFMLEIDLVDGETIHQINKQYRNIDRETDVISFAFEDNKENLKAPSDYPRDLGEIFICVPVAHRQSEEYQHSFEREMMFLACHGVLHLLGYDHMKPEDEKVMFAIQDEIMKILNLEVN